MMLLAQENTIYNKKYSDISLPKDDWLIQRGKLIKLIIKELNIDVDDSVLDIGCDDGTMRNEINKYAKEVIGIDINKDVIEGNSMTRVMDATEMDFASGSFDKIYSSHTIEHIKNLEAVFKEVSRILKSNGLVLFVYPWELWRGMAHARGAWKILGNPFLGHRFHVHKLNPEKVMNFAKGTRLKHLKSFLIFMRTPQYVSLFRKI